MDVPDPALDGEGFVRAIATWLEALPVSIVLPGSEDALIALTGRERLLPEDITVGTCSADTTSAILDKRGVLELAGRCGLDVPAWADLDRDAATPDGLVPPYVLKPVRSKEPGVDGGLVHLEVHLAATPGDLSRLAAETWAQAPSASLVVQQHVTGSLSAATGVAWRGEIVSLCHQRSPRTWPPTVGVTAYATTVAPDLELERRIAGLVGALGWSGPFQLQFLEDGDRRWLIDLNPRVFGSLGLTIAAGHNLLGTWVALLRGERPHVGPYRVGQRFRNERRDARALLHAARSGSPGAALRGALPRRHTAHAWFSLQDPRPSLPSRARLREILSRS